MAKSEFPSQNLDKFVVRLPEGMRERIAQSAQASNRSMNAEIVARLEASFIPHEGMSHKIMQTMISVAVETAMDVYDQKLQEAGLLPKPGSRPNELAKLAGSAADAKLKRKR